GVSKALESPFKNMAFVASVAQNANQVKGVWVVNPDATTADLYAAESQTFNFDYISASTFSDGRVAVGNQNSGLLQIMEPTGESYRNVGATGNFIYTRTVRAFGNSDTGTVVYIDAGSTAAPNT